MFIDFLIANIGITGPAYLSDEVGYLAKASTFAGSTVHISSSWFGGYPILISPAFLASANPYTEWAIILVLNAAMWAGSAWLLQYVLRRTHPTASRRAVHLATLGALLYPSWVSMSGYAFATSGFVLVLMAALAALLKSRFTNRRWLLVSAALTGYLGWIHPLGFLFIGLYSLLFATKAIVEKRWLFGVVAVLGAMGGVLYLAVVHPWFAHAMRGSVAADSHYATKLPDIQHALLTAHFWVQFGELLIGLCLYTVAATFGLAVFGAGPLLKRAAGNAPRWRTILADPAEVVPLLSVLTVISVIGLVAFTTANEGQLRVDQWIYGRYTDMYLLPLLGFALLSAWRLRHAATLAWFVLAAGVLLSLITNSTNTVLAYDNKVNIQAFWPMHVTSVVHANYYWLWGLLGAIGVVFVGFCGARPNKKWLILLIFPVLLTGGGNYRYHHSILQTHSSVSSLYAALKDHYAGSSCIGFTPVPDSHERFALYSYYLHGTDLKKMSLSAWEEQGCSGPYLTYDFNPAASPGLQAIARESTSGLYVIVPSTDQTALQTFRGPGLSQTLDLQNAAAKLR